MKIISSEFERLLGGFLEDALEGADLDRFLSMLEDPDHPERRERLNALLATREVLTQAGQRNLGEGDPPINARSRTVQFTTMALLAACLIGLLLTPLLWRTIDPAVSSSFRGTIGPATQSVEAGMAFSIIHADGSRVARGMDGTVVSETDTLEPLISCALACRVAVARQDDHGNITWLGDSRGTSFLLVPKGGSLVAPRLSMKGLTGTQRLLLAAWPESVDVSLESIKRIRNESELTSLRPKPETTGITVKIAAAPIFVPESGRIP